MRSTPKKYKTLEDKIEYVISRIKNVKENFKYDIEKYIRENLHDLSTIKILKQTRKHFKFPSFGRGAEQYWISRGWEEYEARYKVSEFYKNKKKRCSPFSIEFWMNKINPETNKNYTEIEADIQRNTLRPTFKEYWLKRGLSELESIEKAKETHINNSKKGLDNNRRLKGVSDTSLEYWLLRGFSEKEAKEKQALRQSTFTLEKCVKKFGAAKGYQKWKERQVLWQNTLNSKSDKEIARINSEKSWNAMLDKMSVKDFIEKSNRIKNMTLVETVDEFWNLITDDLNNNPMKRCWPIKKYYDGIQNIQIKILNMTFEMFISKMDHMFHEGVHLISSGNKQSYRSWIDENTLLRSSYEILFFDRFVKKFDNWKTLLKVDNRYPESLLRYDFLINDKIYVEVCPMYGKNEEYTEKMDKKVEMFGSILLKTTDDIERFIENYD